MLCAVLCTCISVLGATLTSPQAYLYLVYLVHWVIRGDHCLIIATLNPMIHGSTFVEQHSNVATAVQQVLNSVSCDVECWNMSFNMLKAVERCWMKTELGFIPFSRLQLVATCWTMSTNRFLSFVSCGLVERSNMTGWSLSCVQSIMAGLSLGGDCASCLHLLVWRMITGVSN